MPTGFFTPSRLQQAHPTAGLVPKCGLCGLYKLCRKPKMKPYGTGKGRVLVVGEAPGQTEDEQGRPFVGKAGQFLRQTLRALDINLDKDAITTNALICRPPANKTPDAKQIDYCRPNLSNTIRENHPRVIVTLGRSALASVLEPYWKQDIGPLERWVGWKIPLSQHWICPTYHPSYLLRMKNAMLDQMFARHLKEAFAITADPPKAMAYAERVQILYNDVDAVEAIRQVEAQGGWVAIDYETNCLKPELPKATIVSCAISNGRQTFAYPFVGRAIEATSQFLLNPQLKKIASNLKFEDRWTNQILKHEVSNWGWDTMLAAHCLDNRPGICSLKFQSLINLGVPTYNQHVEAYLQNSRGPYNRISEVNLSELLLYNGMDAVLEVRLARLQREWMGYENS